MNSLSVRSQLVKIRETNSSTISSTILSSLLDLKLFKGS